MYGGIITNVGHHSNSCAHKSNTSIIENVFMYNIPASVSFTYFMQIDTGGHMNVAHREKYHISVFLGPGQIASGP